ncbi:hypothetical protein JDV02_002906 [Purpureocillium takamizusanense]|uniref:MYND-type domain-containing protein n=1 Tax=Purpureocillium takamizusanense TaxID=2060973 RepID=A0A9Q8V7X1_9HYPO|nr:uncharacterized protein JDV02_002906 [Purpureocillium takamizusanense]UNI16475.1 hypothetical protein JDV02_002906 [Purpureocillium takamizusanense]
MTPIYLAHCWPPPLTLSIDAMATSGAYSITQPMCAARQGGKPCSGIPRVPCPKCLVVAYCDSACLKRDWGMHKRDCCAEIPDDRGPPPTVDTRSRKCFWSIEPATDMINLEKNEGVGFDDELRLLLTGFTAFRHFIYAITKLPKQANPKIKLFLNECDFPHSMRAFIALHLLSTRSGDPAMNAEAVIHSWYSSRVPKAIWQHIRSIVDRPVVTVLANVGKHGQGQENGPEAPCRSRLKEGRFQMDTEFTAAQWQEIWGRLCEPGTIMVPKATVIRFLDVRKHSNPAVVYKARMTRARQMGLQKWQFDGCLLPYAHPRDDFDTVNPLFLHKNTTFPPGATQEPMGEWPMEYLDNTESPAPNDVYGKLFYYLRSLLLEFQQRLQTLDVYVQLTSESAGQLVHWEDDAIAREPFDRIAIGDLWDMHPLLTLVAFSRILAHRDENPNAALLAHTAGCLFHNDPVVSKDKDREEEFMYKPTKTVLDEYAPPVPADISHDDPKSIRRNLGLLMWRNWDRFAAKYFSSPERFAYRSLMPLDNPVIEHESVFQAGFLGMIPREKHRVVPRWPLRLVHGNSSKPSLRDFNRYMSWGTHPTRLSVRWMEWVFSGQDPRDAEWELWMAFSQQRSPEECLRLLKDKVNGVSASRGGSDDEVTIKQVEEGMGNMSLQMSIERASGDSTEFMDPFLTDDLGSEVGQSPMAAKTAGGGGGHSVGRRAGHSTGSVFSGDKSSHTLDVEEVSEPEEAQSTKKAKKKKKKKKAKDQ